MHSPLPDSSALEAGIIEDPTPTRLNHIQSNVRNLLRNSVLASIRSSDSHISRQQQPQNLPHTPPRTPDRTYHSPTQPEVLPSPTDSEASTNTANSADPLFTGPSADTYVDNGGLFPPPDYGSSPPRVGQQSTLFNCRAVAALNHPDMNDPSLAVLAQQKAEKRQRRAFKRKRSEGRLGRSSARSRKGDGSGSQCLLCIIAALMLGSVVATYLILATRSKHISTTFHVLFILGILLATIVFAHTLIRLLLFSGQYRRGQGIFILPPKKPRHHQHRRRHHRNRCDSQAVQQVRSMPSLSTDAAEFVPATPIRIQTDFNTTEVRPDAASPTEVDLEAQTVWDKAPSPISNPPPAYGRWRGSVRANPDFLHWQAIPSPIDDDAQELPSPTYEEAMLAQRTGPPSYVTRESPARSATRGDVRASVVPRADEAVVEGGEPEMIEVVGVAK